jgi:hypothetical protein
MKKHSSYISHLDFTEDGESLKSTSGDADILYWSSVTCRHLTHGKTLFRDEKWLTLSCTLDFNVRLFINIYVNLLIEPNNIATRNMAR